MDSFFQKLVFTLIITSHHVFHTFCDISEQTGLIRGEATGRRFFKVSEREIYQKYISADMLCCCRVPKRWQSSVWDGGDSVIRM